MWNWFNCYLSGRHEFGVRCEPGSIYLGCLHCGRRSAGWSLHERTPTPEPAARPRAERDGRTVPVTEPARILPFERTAS